jgi:hypothetical protein
MNVGLKEGVRIQGISNEMTIAFAIIIATMTRLGYSTIITSCIDGKHSRGSLHYVGNALDIRHNIIPEDRREAVRQQLAIALGMDFDVVLEKTHFHIEYQPKVEY